VVDSLQIAIVVVIVLVAAVFFYLLPRYGPHKKSTLTCPKCKKQFTYHWVPGASWASIGRGSKRNLRCPYCHQVSTFDLAAAPVGEGKRPSAARNEWEQRRVLQGAEIGL